MYILVQLHEYYRIETFLALFKSKPDIYQILKSQGYELEHFENYTNALERCLLSLEVPNDKFEDFVLQQCYNNDLNRLNWGLRKVEFSD